MEKNMNDLSKTFVIDGIKQEPFDNSEDAWFWFCQANEAKRIGARCSSGKGETLRPCEPEDIMNIVNRLYKQRTLLIDHVRILAHYGKKLVAPDKKRFREQKANTLWKEAFSMLEPVFLKKGIIKKGAFI